MNSQSDVLVEILLATYNGKRFLKPLLESLEMQSHRKWRLIVRDDGSTDRTLQLIRNFKSRIENSSKPIENSSKPIENSSKPIENSSKPIENSSKPIETNLKQEISNQQDDFKKKRESKEKIKRKNQDKVHIVKDRLGNLGPIQNFALLLKKATANYIMFCDQDDLWKTTKIENTLTEIQQLEKEYPEKPVLVHSDLTVIDETGQIIADSFWKMQKLDPRVGDKITKLLFHNVVTGCTVMINKRAQQIVLPIPPSALMHDYWIALIVAKKGIVASIPEQTMFYRQHAENQVGAKNVNLLYVGQKLKSFICEFQKYLTMFHYLPFSAPIGKGIWWKLILSIQRIAIPKKFF